MTAPNRLILLDTYGLIYRAYHALPPMSTSDGMATNAVYGLASMLPRTLNSGPALVIAAFDLGKPAFRTDVYPAYKQGRKPMPDDLRPQIALCQKLLEVLAIPCLGISGFEADDVIGTVSRMAEEKGLRVRIVSGDLDCLQLVSEQTEVMVPRRGITDTVIYDPQQVCQRYGVEPSQMIDFKALRGDASDNVAGVPGVGDKTATRLLQQFGSVESLLERLDELPVGRIRTNLTQHADQLQLAKQIVTIRRDAPVECDFEVAGWPAYDLAEVAEFFRQLEFRDLIRRLPAPRVAVAATQPSLFVESPPAIDDLQIIDTAEAWAVAKEELTGARELAIEGLWEGAPRAGELVGLAVAGNAGEWYIAREFCSPLLEALRDIPLLAHDLSALELALRSSLSDAAIDLNWSYSTAIAAYLIGGGSRDPNLEGLAPGYLDRSISSIEQLRGKGRSVRLLADCLPRECASYAVPRASAILALHPLLSKELRSEGMDYLFQEIELPLVGVLVEMEEAGIALDVDFLRSMQEELNRQLKSIEIEIYQLVGSQFNLNAPQQLARVLFEELKLPPGRRTKTGYSTDAETLEGLRDKHPAVSKLLEHRQLSKLKSTYVDSLPLLVDPRDGRVHTSLNQAATATGRLSSSNP
ncbi:MAG: DNA polymerase, partial [Candidatus Dormibacteraceae bacterium]